MSSASAVNSDGEPSPFITSADGRQSTVEWFPFASDACISDSVKTTFSNTQSMGSEFSVKSALSEGHTIYHESNQ